MIHGCSSHADVSRPVLLQDVPAGLLRVCMDIFPIFRCIQNHQSRRALSVLVITAAAQDKL